MNRGTFIRALAGSALAFPVLAAAAETPAETEIYDLLDAALDAQFAYDFRKLAKMLHPASLTLFRDTLSARFDQLLRSYPLDQISAVSGLGRHPKDLDASDVEIFIGACNRAQERHPEFVGSSKLLPIDVHGTLFDNDRYAYVVFSYAGAVHTERTDFRYVAPRIMTVHRDGDRWHVYSCVLAETIIDNWWRDLAKPKEAAPVLK